MLKRALPLAVASLPLLAAPALAHHPLGGSTPATFSEGLLSGIGHPILGFDHLAFVIAIGLIAATLRTRHALVMPLAYLGAMAGGLLLHLGGVMLPAAEWVIMISVMVLGFLVARGRGLTPVALGGLFAIAGLFHGFAFAESILGAEPTPIVAYVIGLVATQYAIALAAFGITRALTSSELGVSPTGVRVAGGVVAGVGLAFFLETLEGAVFSEMVESASALLSLPAIG